MNNIAKNCMLAFKPFIVSCMLIMNITACNNKDSNSKTTTTTVPNTETKKLVFDKLVGIWKSEDGKSFEQWTKKDTSLNEQATIYRENDNWIFENTVKDQNDGKAIKFISTLFNEKTVQFSNPLHDFPTDVNYTMPDANTVNAFISGPNKKGGKDTIPFNYTRLK